MKDEEQFRPIRCGFAWIFFLLFFMGASAGILNKVVRNIPSIQAHLHSLYTCEYEVSCGYYLFGIPLSYLVLPWIMWPLADLGTIAVAPRLGSRQRMQAWLTRYRPPFVRRLYAWLLSQSYVSRDEFGHRKDGVKRGR